MFNLKRFNFNKFVASLLVVILFTILPLEAPTKAATITEAPQEQLQQIANNITEEQFNNSLEAIRNGLYSENDVYKFDREKAGTTLTPEQLNNLETFFSQQPQNVMKDIYEGANNPDEPVSLNTLTDTVAPDGIQHVVPIVLVFTFKGLVAAASAVAAFVGATIAALIVADLYKLAVAGYCQKYKKYSQIKRVCNTLGFK
ncbi:TPA: hypothetical protein ROY00_005172 [Bacillus mobilis]|nr:MULTISPECIES: hypothetical protein [Bacillus]AYF06464.1 hypothetical protein MLA2C4_12535 [Bacillus mobilis]BCD29298.1 hypothetical protein BC30102_2334 [Bacillus cereus]HDX9575521.1 hypothetical protein [Bacillus mobilis]